MDDDMLVYPEEFKMGMKEELEHTNVIGKDKEALKKIVLAHLKEDAHYYSKLSHAMKAEEEKRLSPIRRSMKGVPHEKETVRNLQTIKAEEETERLTPHYKPSKPPKPTGYKMSPKEEVETTIHLHPAKAEEKSLMDMGKQFHIKSPRQQDVSKPGGSKLSPKVTFKTEEEYDPSKGGRILAPVKKAEEDNGVPTMKKVAEEVPKVPRTIPGTKAPKTRSYLESRGLLTKNKAEEDGFTPHSKSPGKTTPAKIPEFKAPKGPAPKSESDLPSERFGSEEKLSSKLIKKAEEELGKDKVDEMKNKTIVEDFAESEKKKAEEKAKPPAFHAEPK